MALQRFMAWIVAMLGGASLILATAGIYGVVSNRVTRRTREIGIRVVLGAKRSEVWQTILRQEMPPVLLGLTIGCAGAAASTRVIRNLLYGIMPMDAPTFAGVLVALAVAAFLAICIPARRAMNVPPATALREE
jgi:ABC-type antimicrobial peptide transport system permease subunit